MPSVSGEDDPLGTAMATPRSYICTLDCLWKATAARRAASRGEIPSLVNPALCEARVACVGAWSTASGMDR